MKGVMCARVICVRGVCEPVVQWQCLHKGSACLHMVNRYLRLWARLRMLAKGSQGAVV